jgi:hypothetical protein
MQSILKRFIPGLALLLCAGCVSSDNYTPTNKTALELQSFQKQDFETSKKVAFAAVLSVFQDMGYILENAELDTGLITAKSPTVNSRGLGYSKMVDTRATAFIEELKPGTTSVRLNFVTSIEKSVGAGQKLASDRPIEDPSIYANAFAKIKEAIFIRKATQ